MGKNMFKLPSPKVIMMPMPTQQSVPTPSQVIQPQLAPAGTKPAGEGGGASFLGSTVIPPGVGGGGAATPGEKKLLGQ